MMETSVTDRRLVGWDVHGFRTINDLDIQSMMDEARSRWLRPNEIHAMLCNHFFFTIHVKPLNLPQCSGTIVLFDRKKLRNFRKDGHNWKKKKDGKTIKEADLGCLQIPCPQISRFADKRFVDTPIRKEAHEHLKVGNEERIHVYYAHGQDHPTFVRRCYWLLDKSLEHIVLVHYRETQEFQSSPVTSANSNSISAPWLLPEETDSVSAQASSAGRRENTDSLRYETKIHEINTLEWDELLDLDNYNDPVAITQGNEHQNKHTLHGSKYNNGIPVLAIVPPPATPCWNATDSVVTDNSLFNNNLSADCFANQVSSDMCRKDTSTVGTTNSLDRTSKDGLQSHDSFGRWINSIMVDSPGSVDDPLVASSVASSPSSFLSPTVDHQQSSIPDDIFCITDTSPTRAFSSERTKILVTGYFTEAYAHLAKSSLFCICGDLCVPAEIVQVGVYRCWVSPHAPGLVNLYLSLDGRTPISQVLVFEYQTLSPPDAVIPVDDNSKWEEFRVQMRLANLLFSKAKTLNFLSNKISPNVLKDAKTYALRTSHIASSWEYLINAIEENKVAFSQAKDNLFELALRNRLQEWLMERIIDGRKITDHDDRGQGVIHLCAILGYRWAVLLYSLSGLSLDYRDKFGWTALHWAAYYGREKMVAVLLSAGAKPNLVTDPTPENHGGCTAADIASNNGHEGLAAYLAEKALVEHFQDMTVAGNVSGSLQIKATEPVKNENVSEELYLKETLAAYRTAADAAARIHTAFREHSFKVRTKAVQLSNPESEAKSIIAAMKIQHAFRKYETRKKIVAVGRIQDRFRSYKIRKNFLTMRHHAIRIQAVYRGHQVRKHYRKITWSVGVLEKAILRWRLKRKGLRGLQVETSSPKTQEGGGGDEEENFFRASRKQAEDRVERSVVKVQAMFRSRKAQEDYRRMKLAHNEAMLEFEEFLDPQLYMNN